MTVATQKRLTLEEFANYDDGTETLYELVDGVLVEMGTEGWDLSRITMFLLSQLFQFVPYHLICHKDTELAVSDDKARIPDLMVVTDQTDIQMTGQKGLIPLDTEPPILIIETVSPGSTESKNYQRDYREKRREYAARRIPEYWIVDGERSVVLVFNLQGNRYVGKTYSGKRAIVSTAFPGLNLTAEQVLKAGR